MSAFFEDDAIALRKARFSESSLMVTWLTSSHGKIATSARGALKPGGSLGGRVDVYHLARISWSAPRRGDICGLSHAEILERFAPPDASALPNLRAAAYFCGVVERVLQPSEPAGEIFDLLRRALRYVGEKPLAEGVVGRFEERLAALLGIAPPDNSSARAALEAYAGGLPGVRDDL